MYFKWKKAAKLKLKTNEDYRKKYRAPKHKARKHSLLKFFETFCIYFLIVFDVRRGVVREITHLVRKEWAKLFFPRILTKEYTLRFFLPFLLGNFLLL